MEKTLVDVFWATAKEKYYDSYGWSVFTECFDAQDAEDFVSHCKDAESVKAFMADIVSIWDDRNDNARMEAGY